MPRSKLLQYPRLSWYNSHLNVVPGIPGNNNDEFTPPGNGATTPPVVPSEGIKSKRKQTLMSLLDALHELSRDGELSSSEGVLLTQTVLIGRLRN